MGISELVVIALAIIFAVFLVPRREKTDESDSDSYDDSSGGPPAFTG